MKNLVLNTVKQAACLALGMAIVFGAFWLGTKNYTLVNDLENSIKCALHEGEAVNYITVEEDTNGDGVMETTYVYYEE